MINFAQIKKKILIVDNDQAVTQRLTSIFESRGYHVTVAHNGKEALAKANSSIDLILLDLVLPDQEGFQLCRFLKESESTKNISMIVLTERVLTKDVVEALYLGADDYLSKPFIYEELVARMEAVMRRCTNLNSESANIVGDRSIILELRQIIDGERIIPHYQPIFLLDPFEIYGYESLSRPQTDSSLHAPDVLFRSAMQYGVYEDLEMIVWKKALAYASEHFGRKKLFLNCNPYLVESSKFTRIKNLFDHYSVRSSDVYLEITERSAISNFKSFNQDLRDYREYGFKFAIDDVGGGYASLESIVETRPEILKIDRHIVTELTKDSLRYSIVKFIVAFCQEHGILSVAEGIESKADLLTVKELGIDAGQGFYLQKPAPITNIHDVIEDSKKYI